MLVTGALDGALRICKLHHHATYLYTKTLFTQGRRDHPRSLLPLGSSLRPLSLSHDRQQVLSHPLNEEGQ